MVLEELDRLLDAASSFGDVSGFGGDGVRCNCFRMALGASSSPSRLIKALFGLFQIMSISHRLSRRTKRIITCRW